MKTSKAHSIISIVLFVTVMSCGEGPGAEAPVKMNGTQGNLSRTGSTSARTTGASFDTTVGDPIPLENARRWAASYRDKNPGETEAHYFGADIIRQILAEEGSVGIRMYYTIDDKGQKQIVLVGVDSNGDNLLPASEQLDASDQNVVVDVSWICPTMCGSNGL